MKILIKNGTVVSPDISRITDVLTLYGAVSSVAADLPANDADRIIDATGMIVLPGGVDPHVHMHLPSPAGFSSDDFLSGSRAALHGGTTTLIDFVTPEKGEPLPHAAAPPSPVSQSR